MESDIQAMERDNHDTKRDNRNMESDNHARVSDNRAMVSDSFEAKRDGHLSACPPGHLSTGRLSGQATDPISHLVSIS